MTTRSTTLVESDQLAQAVVNVLRNDELVPKGKRWPFARVSRAYREYERALSEIAARRGEARQRAIEEAIAQERTELDAEVARAEQAAQAAHDEQLSQARKPYDEVEVTARAKRDAALAAAEAAYREVTEQAKRAFQEAQSELGRARSAEIAQAQARHAEALAALATRRAAEIERIAKELNTIPLEGPMRIVEDRHAWSREDRRKALIGLLDMAGRADLEAHAADLCLRSVASYVARDRFLKPDEQHYKLMDVALLEALVELATRSPSRRPSVVKTLHDIVTHNPGYSSPTFIRELSALYVITSADNETRYVENLAENERIFDEMRALIADTLKLTPRRSQLPPPLPLLPKGSSEQAAEGDPESSTADAAGDSAETDSSGAVIVLDDEQRLVRSSDVEISAEAPDDAEDGLVVAEPTGSHNLT